MRHSLRNSSKFRFYKYCLEGYTRRLNNSPVIVLGNQKSGTSAIAALLGEMTGLTYSIDLRDEIRKPIFDKVYSGDLSLKRLIRKNRLDFTRDIVKEPNLSLLLPKLKKRFPESKVVMIVRDPFDNIRSLLDRLDIPGNTEILSDEQNDKLSLTWKKIIFNSGLNTNKLGHIENMAYRWNLIVSEYFKHDHDLILVRYEDFNKDKTGTIKSLAKRLGLKSEHDIAGIINKQFQQKGNTVSNYLDYFGKVNYDIIFNTCSHNMRRLGYVDTVAHKSKRKSSE